MSTERKRDLLRAAVRGAYDIQKLRIEMGQRLYAAFAVRTGVDPGEKQDEMDEDAATLFKSLKASYTRVTDGLAKFPSRKHFKGDEIISEFTELLLVRQYFTLLTNETQQMRDLEKMVEEFPIWNEWLVNVAGIGPTIGAIIISYIDIRRAQYASSIFRYCGLDVVHERRDDGETLVGDDGAPVGRARSMRKEHMVDTEYTARDGTTKTKRSLTFNPFLKAKIVFVMGGSFMKNMNCKYRVVYDDYRNRYENHAIYGAHNDGKEIPGYGRICKARRMAQARRAAVKAFLSDLYVAWRTLENLPVHDPYAVAKLGMKPHREAV